MENYTIVEKYQQTKNSSIAIRPFFNPDRENMGLEQYGMALHDAILFVPLNVGGGITG